MIVVTIEKWPHGNPHEKRELGRVEIVNDMTGDIETSTYQVALKERRGASQRYDVLKTGQIDDFPRGKYDPDRNPYALLMFALRACLAPRKKEAAE